MTKRRYEDIFPDIAERHPRTELDTFGKIVAKVHEDESEGREVTQTILARQINIKRQKVVNRVGILERRRFTIAT